MKLSIDFLKSNPLLTTKFVSTSLSDRREFFQQLKSVASNDLSLAHSVFKVSAARTVMCLSSQSEFQLLSDKDFIAAFSVYKSFDTAQVNSDYTAVGKKHWITNLSLADFAIVQLINESNTIGLYYVDLGISSDNSSVCRDFSFLNAPGLSDTCTGDVDFDNHPVTLIFNKSDSRYFVSNNHNNLCFIANYLGGANGLLACLDKDANFLFKSTLKNLTSLLDKEIDTTSDKTIASDSFWHTRNALYIDSKKLLGEICKYIVSNCAGNFYNLNSQQGQHFYDCLIYSGHDGPVSRSRQRLYTESQDY